jgi:hypothetical protein
MPVNPSIRAALYAVALASAAAAGPQPIRLDPIGSWHSGIFARGGAEISAYDSKTRRLFVVNGASASLTVLDLSNPSAPALVATLPFPAPVNSVSACRGLVAVAVEAVPKTDPGQVAFFRADFPAGATPPLRNVAVGALPDMLSFTANGHYVLVANEGEPGEDYASDPEGSISIIDVRGELRKLGQAHVRTVTFSDFNADGSRAAEVPAGIRTFGPGATLSQDLEPEYITFSEDNRTAYVTLQEHNALAIVDIKAARVEKLVHLGYKDHSLAANAFDASDRDGRARFESWPVLGMYQPDAIAAFKHGRETYLITANEGDVRDWPAFSEERRVGALALDPAAFPDAATLRNNANLGRLKVTSTLGDADGDGRYEELYAFGGRSFSIWDGEGSLVFDSGDEIERRMAALIPDNFNSDHEDNNFDNRSDDKGPEPEGVAVGTVDGRAYAFIGLERQGGILVYDLGRPQYPAFVDYVNTRDFSGDPEAGTAGDLGPEGLLFIPKGQSPSGKPLLVACHEVSGSVTVFQIEK